MHELLSDKYYRYIFENSLDAILLTKPNDTIIRANKAACLMFERSEEELRQLGKHGIVDANDPRFISALKERQEKGEVKVELYSMRKDGARFPIHLSSKVFKDENGEMWAVVIIKDITNEKYNQNLLNKLQEDTLYLANHDYLTEAYNRRGFMEVFQNELKRSVREKTNCGIALIDIDYFKVVNDKYGHLTGDLILKFMVIMLKECLRPYDTIGRFGGDEFILCMPNLDIDNARIIGERLIKHIQENPYFDEEQKIHLTISIGIKVIAYDSIEDCSINQYIKDVDNLMYYAKQYRNSVQVSV